MKKSIIFLAIFMMLTGFSFRKYHREDKMNSFKWVIGNWSMKTGRGVITESWTVVDDSSYAGESSMVRSTGEVKLLEKIQFVWRNNGYFYIPIAQDQNNNQPVKFKITSHSESGFVAENPEHDFPKRITYVLVNKDSIHAFIDGGPAMPEKKSDFYYTRSKN